MFVHKGKPHKVRLMNALYTFNKFFFSFHNFSLAERRQRVANSMADSRFEITSIIYVTQFAFNQIGCNNKKDKIPNEAVWEGFGAK